MAQVRKVRCNDVFGWVTENDLLLGEKVGGWVIFSTDERVSTR